MSKVYPIRSLIYSKYDSEAKLAAELGWPRQKLNKITNGIKEPDIYEVKALSDKLDRSTSEIIEIFLSSKSPND